MQHTALVKVSRDLFKDMPVHGGFEVMRLCVVKVWY